MRKYTPCPLTSSLFDGKVCPHCKTWYPYSWFHQNITGNDGHRNLCKSCRKNYHRSPKQDPVAAIAQEREYLRQIYEESAFLQELCGAYPSFQMMERLQDFLRRIGKDRYYDDDREKMRANYAARKVRLVGSYTDEEWAALCAKYDYRCLMCGEQKKLTVDHIIPVSQGGPNTIDNLQPLCRQCNSKKKTKTLDMRY